MSKLACNCNGGKKKVHYQVQLANGQNKTFPSIAEAQKAAPGAPIKAVNAA